MPEPSAKSSSPSRAGSNGLYVCLVIACGLILFLLFQRQADRVVPMGPTGSSGSGHTVRSELAADRAAAAAAAPPMADKAEAPLLKQQPILFSEKWSFSRYVASPYEKEWSAAVRETERASQERNASETVHVVPVCRMNESPQFKARLDEYIRVTNGYKALSDSANECEWSDRKDEVTEDRNEDVFSYFEYTRTFAPCDATAIDFTAPLPTVDAPPAKVAGASTDDKNASSEVESYIRSKRGVKHSPVPDHCRPLTAAELVEYRGDAPAMTRRSYIEPIAANMRHPEHCRKGGALLAKNYMQVDSGPLKWGLPFFHKQAGSAETADPIERWMATPQGKELLKWTGNESTVAAFMKRRAFQLAPMSVPRPPRVFFFDLGASTWLTGAGGTSQQWFYQVYNSRCVDLSNFNGWEMIPHKAKDIWDPVAGPLKPGYRYFNVPLKTDEKSWDNPLRHLEVLARPEDIVIFKVDFDAPLIESAIIDEILRKPHIAALIDDFYYEHHVQLERLAPGPWGGPHGKELLSASLDVFDGLRRMGIRAHSWV